MAGKSVISVLAQKYKGFENAVIKHKDDETTYSNFGDLPPGVNGIAQLKEVKFDVVKEGKNNAGEYFFSAYGIVVEPVNFTDKEGNNHRTAGKRTSVIEMLCPTPNSKGARKTVEDHINFVLNTLRLLGIDTSKMNKAGDLETYMAALNQAKPYFQFRTWQGKATPEYPDPKVNHTWEGVVANYIPTDESEGGTDDDTEAGASGSSDDEGDSDSDEGYRDDDDLASLGERAENGDKEAQDKLSAFAKKAGVDAKKVKNADTWNDVVDMINEASAPKDEEDEEEEDEGEEQSVDPEVGQIFEYKPLGKDQKPLNKAVDVEVTKVYQKNKKVDLKNLNSGKEYKSVEWAKLIEKD